MSVKITECPRDAMQGVKKWIPTQTKIDYLNQLLKVGFDVLDFGSFVSPKAIPQMKDTAEVLGALNLSDTDTKLLAIVANERGAKDAGAFNEITFLGYPFSISETFQQRNTNASIEDSLRRVETINELARSSGQSLLVYISMAFGNPYGDPWSPDLAAAWIERLNREFEIADFAMADTVGVSNEESISNMFKTIIPAFENLNIGAHLHSTPETSKSKIEAAFNAGCRRFDGAINGLGGCPMAEDELVGNIDTAVIINAIKSVELESVNALEFQKSIEAASKVFP